MPNRVREMRKTDDPSLDSIYILQVSFLKKQYLKYFEELVSAIKKLAWQKTVTWMCVCVSIKDRIERSVLEMPFAQRHEGWEGASHARSLGDEHRKYEDAKLGTKLGPFMTLQEAKWLEPSEPRKKATGG